MIVEFEDGTEPKAVMNDVLKACKKVEQIVRLNFRKTHP